MAAAAPDAVVAALSEPQVVAAPNAAYDDAFHATSRYTAAGDEILHDTVDFDPDLAMADDEALPPAADEGVSPMLARGADAYAAYAPPVTKADAVVEDADETEERFSLRTRSMAEVLAEQGDIKGALDIYHELAASAVHPEESADLRQRIATLTARLGNAQTMDSVQPAAPAEQASGKDKLISMAVSLKGCRTNCTRVRLSTSALPAMWKRWKRFTRGMRSCVVSRLHGENELTGLTVKELKTGQESHLPVDGLFVYVGYEPSTAFLPAEVVRDEQGFIITDTEMRTSIPGIFAAGDIRSKLCRQVITAAGDGATAAQAAFVFLEQLHVLSNRCKALCSGRQMA